MRGKNSGSVNEEICGLKETFKTLLVCVHWSKFIEWNTRDFCVFSSKKFVFSSEKIPLDLIAQRTLMVFKSNIK